MFSIRVELHDANWSDYVKLAESLSRVGIIDIITSDNGIRYRLPPAEYNYVGNSTLEQVYEATTSAAASTGRKYAVVAAEATRRKWSGLDKA